MLGKCSDAEEKGQARRNSHSGSMEITQDGLNSEMTITKIVSWVFWL